MRVNNWQKNFWQVIDDSRERQFEWGKFDCATFVIDCIAAVRGQQFKEEVSRIYGQWSTALQASRATTAGMNLCAAVVLGKTKAPWLLQMGDLGIFKDDQDRDVYCIHDGANFVCPAAVGLQRVPFEKVYAGWSI